MLAKLVEVFHRRLVFFSSGIPLRLTNTYLEHSFVKRGHMPCKRHAYLFFNTVLRIAVQVRNLSKSNLPCLKFVVKDSIFLDEP